MLHRPSRIAPSATSAPVTATRLRGEKTDARSRDTSSGRGSPALIVDSSRTSRRTRRSYTDSRFVGTAEHSGTDTTSVAEIGPGQALRPPLRHGRRTLHGKMMYWISIAPLNRPDRRIDVVFRFPARDRNGGCTNRGQRDVDRLMRRDQCRGRRGAIDSGATARRSRCSSYRSRRARRARAIRPPLRTRFRLLLSRLVQAPVWSSGR